MTNVEQEKYGPTLTVRYMSEDEDESEGEAVGAPGLGIWGGIRGANSYFGGGKIEFLKRYCYTATGGRIS